MITRIGTFFLTLSSLAGLATADNIIGRVVGADGIGVAGVDIDVDNVGSGGDPDIFNDGTDAQGFFNTTLPAGLYIVRFTPPPPPASTHLILDLPTRAYVGTVDLGTIVLPPGVAVNGHLVDEAGLPVAGVNLDAIANGVNLPLNGDTSNAFGNFSVAVPAGPVTFQFKTAPVLGRTLAPREMEVSLAGNTNLGDILLQNGVHLTGTIRRPNGTAFANLDVDLYDTASGQRVFTPGDDTNISGVFDVVVARGTYDFECCPPLATRLAATDVEGIAVQADLNLGTLTLLNGFVLSGRVRLPGDLPAVGVDLEVAIAATGQSVVTCNDDSDAQGLYAVVLPVGTHIVTYAYPGSTNPIEQARRRVVMNGDRFELITMPTCVPCNGDQAGRGNLGDAQDELTPFTPPLNYGQGTAGTGGLVPHLGHTGGLARINGGWALLLENGLGGRPAVLTLGSKQTSLAALGGTLLVDPFVDSESFNLTLGGTLGTPGAGFAVFPLPPVPESFIGLEVFAQFGVFDPGAPGVLSMSDGLRFTLAP